MGTRELPEIYQPGIEPQGSSTMDSVDNTEYKIDGRVIKKETIDKLATVVKQGYDTDLNSLDDLHEMWNESLKLATQVLEKKEFPFEKSSNVVYPIITEAAMNFNAMMYPNVMADGNICKCKVAGDDDGFPVMQQDPQTGQTHPAMNPDGSPVMQHVGIKAKLAGSISKAVNYQLNEEIEGWEEELDKMLIMLPIIGCLFKKVYYDECEAKVASDLILPHYFIVNFATKNLKSAPRMTQVVRMYGYEIQEKMNLGIFYKNTYRPGDGEFPDKAAQESNSSLPSDDAMKAHLVLEQHLRYDLDGDGYAEPLIVVYHHDSGKVMRIEENYDINAESTMLAKDGKLLYAKPKQYFVKFGFIPNPKGGFYDIGFGQLLLGLNTGINAIINQCIDAGTLSVAGGGFIGRGIRMKAGVLRFKPSEWKVIETTGASLKDSIFPIPYNEPSPVLFQLLGLLIEAAEKIGSMKDILAGEASNQTATTTLSMIEQGVKSLKAISKRIFRGVKDELKLIFELNEKYYPEINDFKITRDLFNYKLIKIIPNMDVENLTNSLKFARAQVLIDMKNSGNQCIDDYESTKRLVESIQMEDIDKVVKPVQATDQEIALQQTLADNKQKEFLRDLMKEQNKKIDLQIKSTKVNAELPKIQAQTVEAIAIATKNFRDAGEPYTVAEVKKEGS